MEVVDLLLVKVSTSPIFPTKSYKSLYLKNSPIKTYKVIYFCPFSIMNLYFHGRKEENSYKHALYVISRKVIGTANQRVVTYNLISVLKVNRIMVMIPNNQGKNLNYTRKIDMN